MQPTPSFHSLIKKHTMKRVYILTILFLLSVSSFAQNDWAPPGATWYYNYQNFWHEGYIKIEYSKDTLLAGQNCKVLQKTSIIYDFLASETDTNVYGFEYTFIDSNIVYAYRNHQFKQIYDFNALTGDTCFVAGWDSAYSFNGCSEDGEVYVDSTDSVTIGLYALKRIFVYPTDSSDWSIGDEIVQRIGSFGFMIPWPTFNCVVDVYEGGDLRCYYDSAFGLYQVGTTPCDFIVGIDESITGNGINVFPNPACSFIQVENNQPQALMLEIFSIIGQLVLSKNLSDQTSIISVQDLDAGMYFLRVRNNEEIIHTERLILE